MTPQLINRIERTNVVLGIAITAVCGIVWKVPGMTAAGLGALLGGLNFWALHRLGAGVFRRAMAGEGAAQAGFLVMLLMAKMGVLFGCVYLAIFVFGLLAVPFSLGISAFVLSILGAALFAAPSLMAEEAESHG
ncbi:MAG: hypothetical protein SF187_13815 [Deltaproteobacteria bacterium]|nr:hypothetical protein [Deltaproteobacteria bacterium]